MKTKFKVALVILILLASTAAIVNYIRTHTISMFEAKGTIGMKEGDLMVTASLLMLIVIVPVYLLTLYFAWKYRAEAKEKHEPDWEHNYIAEYCWWGVPIIIVGILSILTHRSSHELDPFKPLVSDKKPLRVQVIALQWKWLFIYPDQGIAAINFVQFPVNTPIAFEITSDAPMNSFWIPDLGGQIYAMPAMRSKLHLIANHEGSYRGCSAQISGTGFAGMVFTAKATTEEAFNNWVQTVQQSPKGLDHLEYDQLVKPSEFVPVSYFILKEPNLFDHSIMKYMMP